MTRHFYRLCAVSAAVFGCSALVHADSALLGDKYFFSASNLPDSFGITIDPETQLETDHGTPPVELSFDGIEERAGGLLVNERVHIWDGVDGGILGVQAAGVDGVTEADLLDWEFPGEIVEFSFRTADGGLYLAGGRRRAKRLYDQRIGLELCRGYRSLLL